MADISIAYLDEDLKEKAWRLGRQLNLGINHKASSQLQVTKEGLWLKFGPFNPMRVDFSWSKWRIRRERSNQHGLVKACNVKPGMTVIDATAGWGRDAALLASFGAKVILLERNPIMQVMLEDALHRQSAHDQHSLSFRLFKCEAKKYIEKESTGVDMIYIDPMHPQRKKAALVKKDLQLLQMMIGPDEDAKHLMRLSLAYPCKKVVVKWPVHLPPLLTPTLSWSGKTVRYDCFISDQYARTIFDKRP